jgi:general secretion pathway protein H
MLTLGTGNSACSTDSHTGFTMVELLVAIVIVALVMAVSVPGSIRFYESIQYRQSVRDVLSLLGTARLQAIDRGQVQDVAFDPEARKISLGEEVQQLPETFALSVTTAREVNRSGVGVIRFYPEGGSSGGDIAIETQRGRGVKLSVDWLMGGVSQASYDLD